MFPQTILNGFILEHICWFYFNQWESVSVHTTQSFVMNVHGLQFTMEHGALSIRVSVDEIIILLPL